MKTNPKPLNRRRVARSGPAVLAIGAHPDDIEFYMAGTLLRLQERGFVAHYLNLSSGSLGSDALDAAQTRRIRRREAKAAAAILGARFHASLTDDLEILYTLPLLRRVAAIVRSIEPSILLTHSPQDYMEDHTATCRLAVTAAFARGMPNYRTTPAVAPVSGDVVVYHAMPHGLRDALRRRIIPGAFVNTGPVQDQKRRALAAHRSQGEWLDASQGMNSHVATMDRLSLEMGKQSSRFEHAEGWRRHLHLGFSAADSDPLAEALGAECLLNAEYERALERGGYPESTS